MKTMRSVLIHATLVCCAAAAYGQDYAVAQLEGSPRHHEWVEVEVADGRRVHAFVAYPERADRAPAVLVIHENRGLTDWVRSFADQVAAAGYVAVAPDLLSGFDAEHDRTSDFATSDAARDAIYRLDGDAVLRDLRAVRDYAAGLPASDGRVVAAGFCWGGSQSFRLATAEPDLAAAMVFYGTAPEDPAALGRIAVPVYGFYGGDDARVNATIPATREVMEAQDKRYDVEVYDGAGHAFMRSGDDPAGEPANRAARDAAWTRLLNILSNL